MHDGTAHEPRREPRDPPHSSDARAPQSYSVQGAGCNVVNGDFNGIQFNGTSNGNTGTNCSGNNVSVHYQNAPPRFSGKRIIVQRPHRLIAAP
jgi:hypothetical protein